MSCITKVSTQLRAVTARITRSINTINTPKLTIIVRALLTQMIAQTLSGETLNYER